MLKFFKKVGPQAVWLASASFCMKACVNEKMSLTNKESIALVSNVDTPVFSAK